MKNGCLKIFISAVLPLFALLCAEKVSYAGETADTAVQDHSGPVTVQGVVIDRDGLPVIGAAVMVKG
ncbi:MAG: hypothetical protein ACI395_06100, partial [Candidatus Cryptobacteroides sp.]